MDVDTLQLGESKQARIIFFLSSTSAFATYPTYLCINYTGISHNTYLYNYFHIFQAGHVEVHKEFRRVAGEEAGKGKGGNRGNFFG